MHSLCIVPCGNRKIWGKYPDKGATKAKDVYIGPFTSKCGKYAMHFYPDSWYILSAKYGFLHPDDIIPETYDVTFNDKSTNPITIKELIKQASTKGLNKYNEIVIVAGEDYAKTVRQVFTSKNIRTPLKGCLGIGYMLQQLNDAIKNDMGL